MSTSGDTSAPPAAPSFAFGAVAVSTVARQSKSSADANTLRSGQKQRDKLITQWCITIGVGSEPDSTVRQDFIDIFDLDNISAYCIALERHKCTGEYHVHAYVKMKLGMRFSVVRDLLSLFSEGYCLDVQSCKHYNKWIAYISKEDFECYFSGIDYDHLSFEYRAFHWGMNADRFDYTDPFLIKHRYNYKFLQGLYEDCQLRKQKFECKLKLSELTYDSWAKSVSVWWNSMLTTNGYKRKQLYLWGESNAGKTTLVENIIGKENMKFVFQPCSGKFSFNMFKPKFHKVILFEEFDFRLWEYYKGLLKRLLEGRSFVFDVKNGHQVTTEFSGPIIIISNDHIPDSEVALLNRLEVIYADGPYWLSEKVDTPGLKESLKAFTEGSLPSSSQETEIQTITLE